MANYIHKGSLLRIVQLALERTSIRGVHRCEGTDEKTIRGWLLKLGQGAKILNARMEALPFNTVEFDEIWSWVGVKEDNKQPHHPPELGARWTFLAVDKKSRAIIVCHSGKRTQATAETFLKTLRTRLHGNLVQLVSDGWESYAGLIPKIFGPHFPYIQIVKHPFNKKERCPIQKRTIQGPENPTVRATSHVERINRFFRHFIPRLTRKTDAFSKSVPHHDAAIELYTAYYNYVWIQKKVQKKGIGTTPAVAAGRSTKPWSLEELITQLLLLAGELHPGFFHFPPIRVQHSPTNKSGPDYPDALRRKLHPLHEPDDRSGPKNHRSTPATCGGSLPPLARPPRQKPPTSTDSS